MVHDISCKFEVCSGFSRHDSIENFLLFDISYFRSMVATHDDWRKSASSFLSESPSFGDSLVAAPASPRSSESLLPRVAAPAKNIGVRPTLLVMLLLLLLKKHLSCLGPAMNPPRTWVQRRDFFFYLRFRFLLLSSISSVISYFRSMV